MSLHLTTPLEAVAIRRLHVGDMVSITGRIMTARDAAHRKILDIARAGEVLPFDASNLGLYHCGPVVRPTKSGWDVVSAGPTTSARMESSQADVLRHLGVGLVIGKGGMGPGTLSALGETGAVYTHFTGGAGALAARAIRRVVGAHWVDELGTAEAVWFFEVERFGPLVVAMDAHGESLYEDVRRTVEGNLAGMHRRIEEEDPS